MTDAYDTTAYGWDTDLEVLALAADLAEIIAERDQYAAHTLDLRRQVDDGIAREVFLHDQINQLRAALQHAGLPLPEHRSSPLTLAA